MQKNENKKIIIYSEISWHFLEQRHHHLADYFAKRNYKVHFVQRVVSRVPSLKELFQVFIKLIFGSKNNINVEKKVPSNVTLRRSLFLPVALPLSGLYNWLIWFILERKYQKKAIIYSFVNNHFLIGGNFPIRAKHALSIFDIIHNWWEFPWHKKLHRTLVSRNIRAYDKIVTDSPAIAKKLNCMEIPHHTMLPGVGLEWLNTASSSSEVAPVFFGNLRSNSDVELIERVSEMYSTELLGLIDSSINGSIENASYLGEFNSADLVKQISKYNLILLPYDDGEFSKTIAPAKYFEALATGSLVVTRAEMDHLPGFDDYVIKLNDLSKASLDGLQDALIKQQYNRESQIEFAKQHLWEKRFSNLLEFLEVN